MLIKKGIAGSIGIAIGKALVLKEDNITPEHRTVEKNKIKSEIKRFKTALELTNSDLNILYGKVLNILGKKHAKLIEAHRLILKDPLITKEIPELISSQCLSAEAALQEITERTDEQFSKIDDGYFSERKHDIFDVAKKINAHLLNTQKESLKNLKEHVILVARNLYPSDTLYIKESNKVLGFCTDLGSKSSHTAIFAQSMGLPAVLGMKDISSQIKSGDTVIVDGVRGLVIICPTKEITARYQERKKELVNQEKYLEQLIGLPSVTGDGHTVNVFVNTDPGEPAVNFEKIKAEGIGLYRTEQLYMNRTEPPEEQEQTEIYRAAAEAVSPGPIIIRTADLGGDKITSFGIKSGKDEKNPFMGLRGIRLSLKYPDLLITQIRAIYKANAGGNIKMLIPMVSSFNEMISVRKIDAAVQRELAEEGFQAKPARIGIMVETPAAALELDMLLPMIDFVSIGSNDLLQYTLAVDRVNQYVSELYEPFHPALLRLIYMIIQTAHKKGKPVSLCGEMASDPYAIALLTGMGIDTLSVPAKLYLRTKNTVRSVNFERAASLAMRALDLPTAREIRALIKETLNEMQVTF